MKNLVTIFFCFLFAIPSVMAQSAKDKVADGKILPGKKGDAAFSLTMQDGWYTYWRMAGDNGLPPKFDWSKSENVKSVEVSWPVPSRFSMMDMHSFGYKDSVTFPLTVTPADPSKPTTLDAKVDIIVCKDICVPESVQASATLGNGNNDSAIAAARAALPSAGNLKDLGMDSAVLGQNAIVVNAFSADGWDSGGDLIVETSPMLVTAPPTILIDEKDKNRAILKLTAPAGADLTKSLFGQKATILLLHSGKAVEKDFSF